MLLSSVFLFQSCDKDDDVDETHPITGLWIGTYNITQAVETGENLYYSFFIRNDDTIQVQSVGADGNTYYGLGTWMLNDSSFQATFTTTNSGQQGVIQNATAVYDKNEGELRNGVVQTEGQFFTANFELKRSN